MHGGRRRLTLHSRFMVSFHALGVGSEVPTPMGFKSIISVRGSRYEGVVFPFFLEKVLRWCTH